MRSMHAVIEQAICAGVCSFIREGKVVHACVTSIFQVSSGTNTPADTVSPWIRLHANA